MKKALGLLFACGLLFPALAGAGEATPKLKLEIYGYIKADAIYQNAYASMDWFPVYVPPGNKCGPEGEDCNEREQRNRERDSFHMTARQSRLGFLIRGPESERGISTRGRLEMDFYGAWPDLEPGRDPESSQGMLTLRRATIEIMGSNWSLLAGNEWMVVSPFAPTVNSYHYGGMAGNLGHRTPQVRLTLYGFDKRLVLQIAACNKVGDMDTLEFDTGRLHAAPAWEAGIIYRGPFTLAVTGHYGQEEIQTLRQINGAMVQGYYGSKIESWSFNVGALIPLGDRFAVNGEWFTGANLDGWYNGGVGQGFVMTRKGDYEPLESSGGWVEIMIKPADNLKFFAGMGVDDPNKNQLKNGMIEPGYLDKLGNEGCTKNSMYYANAWFNINPAAMISFEWMQIVTEYELADGRDAGIPKWDNGKADRYTLSFWYVF